MKRFIALLCAGVLTCSMGMMAFAAQSPDSSDVNEEEVKKVEEAIKDKVTEDTVKDASSEVKVDGTEITYTDKDGKEQKVSVSEIQIKAVTDTTAKSAVVEKAKNEAAKVISSTAGLESANVEISVKLMDVTFPANVEKVTMTFSIPGVKAGDKVIGLHWNGSAWETSTVNVSSVMDGKVVATCSGFSPIAFVTVSKVETTPSDNNNDDDDDDTTTTTTTDGTTKSPKTGDAAMPFVVVFAVAAIAAATVAGKKAIN